MQNKWRNTDLNVYLYWPDFLALPLKWSPNNSDIVPSEMLFAT